ncbi:D-tyrosyl-tRNA(Tyr) deacylase [Kwoniella mangroviensis CBS 10435]|uniref:D-aminoacyl-tRNA deacylase n=1 Tax=Kwoniella mangroviensis CBS 10435 TaxID=1331196 RepID=A0A1B9IF47_9TREE|nr:D-tyrosyl-tRNA(Tyr) deacylase [Kwoniella mangroviensis CBS 8507]OCF54175.1 D-tyrosyl-tRNA(Tyr) deacylase [Kwoniella mangroviensis CBS 10435]OCF66019.1 D-tyrosyl-tRNA(Tyr) deacylase [Kwoniella mangroviensis CBS 8507]
MKAVVQRVVNASVAVDGQTISSIGKGLLVLVGIDRYDEPSDATQIIRKVLTARLFDDDQGGMWKKSVKDIDGEVLCVSQFTLLANFKGSKPDFHESMSTIPGKGYYTSFMDEIKKAYHPSKIKDGQFGAMMQVSLTNDGPVTILLSSRSSTSSKSTPAPGTTISRSSTPSSTKAKGKSKRPPETPSELYSVVPAVHPPKNSANSSVDVASISSITGTIASVGLGPSGMVRESDVQVAGTGGSRVGDHGE